MKNEPNIFHFATSELSQDAFIAWLLSWANQEHKPENKQLHQLGLVFLQSLLAKQNRVISEISNLEIKTQFYKIDVFVSFKMDNKHFGIIIEDKIFSSNHSNQLIKYKTLVENKNFDIVVPIYFKTGFQHSYKDVINKGYAPYTIKDFIKVLQIGISQGIDNAILTNFFNYIQEREKQFDDAKNAYENYKSVPISKWNWWSCSGFFEENKKQFNAGWSSVGNNRQPLLAFWFGHRHLYVIDDVGSKLIFKPYIDILYSHNSIKINFRIDLNNNPQTNNKIRNKIFDAFTPYLKKASVKHKKAKFRKAKETILLAHVTALDTSIKYSELISNLVQYKTVLDEFVDNYNLEKKEVKNE